MLFRKLDATISPHLCAFHVEEFLRIVHVDLVDLSQEQWEMKAFKERDRTCRKGLTRQKLYWVSTKTVSAMFTAISLLVD